MTFVIYFVTICGWKKLAVTYKISDDGSTAKIHVDRLVNLSNIERFRCAKSNLKSLFESWHRLRKFSIALFYF